jgi:hypothetical protein
LLRFQAYPRICLSSTFPSSRGTLVWGKHIRVTQSMGRSCRLSFTWNSGVYPLLA